VNSFAIVAYLLHTLCAMALEEAIRLTFEVHQHGSAEVGTFPAQAQAEELVVAFQRRGLHATTRPA
jgi:ATP-dependent Clp protease adapter protein ClpS